MILAQSLLNVRKGLAIAATLGIAWTFTGHLAATGPLKAENFPGIFTDEKESDQARLEALKSLFSKHFRRYGTLAECALFFKHCHWIQPKDWQVVHAMTGVYPFEENGPFAATWFRTRIVAVKMRPAGFEVPNTLWLGLPLEDRITEEEIGLLLSGTCPERLAKSHLLDSEFEWHWDGTPHSLFTPP